MRKMQQLSKWFLALAYLIVMICMVSRIAMGQLIFSPVTSVQASVFAEDHQDDIDNSLTPCELSTKSLVSIPPVITEALLLIFSVLLALLVFIPRFAVLLSFTIPLSSPRLRIHLRLCNFRE